eukprot:CAMPEP_0182420120 /NCGR_PEP_ID=MMETSP1167-20130531/4666_1 /TAXON_ID=2988 /ORGANISM="Mallomonas Sp, Strain CCMP3275" /LENGTH=159 /DNA_ID=CAMNT_0024595617 /DNA_START=306 /DNA_END=782 /DNA_ORIENTATION=+
MNDTRMSIENMIRLGNLIEFPWIERFESGDYPLVIFNRGAHFLSPIVIKESLRWFLPYIQRVMKEKNLTVIYRNTAAGHTNCHHHNKPGRHRHDSNDPNYRDHFMWEHFHIQNQILEEAFRSIQVLILDANATSYLRPDSHSGSYDCLHYCIPGPVDTW